MKSLGIVVGCVLGAAGLFTGLVKGTIWLTKPDPALTQDARIASISQRIAENVQRSHAPPHSVNSRTSKLAMNETAVALPIQRTARMRALTTPRPAKRKPPTKARAPAQEPAVWPPSQGVLTARTDFPF